MPKGKDRSYCLVLSGGGTKGIYHMGVWKALRELNISVHAFIGNSIGSIIAAFLTQGETKFLEKAFHEMDLEAVINIPDSLKKDGNFSLTPENLNSFKEFFFNLTQNRGFDTSPFRQLIEAHLDEDKIRKSGFDLGMTTFNLSTFSPKEIFIEDIEQGNLIDYLMASSALPGFISPKINDHKFIDGGVYNNIPYNLARSRGYRSIIVSDMSGLGISQKLDYTGANIIYIRNSIKMGGALNFDPLFLTQFYKLGYLDTLKTFEKLTGRLYFIQNDPHYESRLNTLLLKPATLTALEPSLLDIIQDQNHSLSLKSIFPKENRHDKNPMMILIDSAAAILELDRIKIYTYKSLIEKIKAQKSDIDQQVEKTIAGSSKNQAVNTVNNLIQNVFSSRLYKEHPYYYYRLIRRILPQQLQSFLSKGIQKTFPEILPGLIFLDLLEKGLLE